MLVNELVNIDIDNTSTNKWMYMNKKNTQTHKTKFHRLF